MWSFFYPLISIDPPILGKNQWSPWSIAQQIYDGNLPNPELTEECERCSQARWALILWAIPKEFTIAYALLPIALFVVAGPAWDLPLALMGGLGALLVGNEFKWRYTAKSLTDIFYGRLWGTQHVHIARLTVTLGIVMLALLMIGLMPDLDESL